jgi:aspartyl-tRNA(Asn)/glutamyl-tRNA(Gln) amidotransferase subunit A
MVLERSIAELRRSLARSELSAVELLAETLRGIEGAKSLNAFITLDPAGATAAAKASDERRARGEALPLDGIPIALKDMIASEGVRTTAGSRILENFVPPYDSTVARKLKAAGAVIVGKTNLDEFAMGSSNEHSAFGPVKNPWDPTRVPGGSSGGSAAAVAARLVPGSYGTDTGGSIRQPASFCGIYGLKPTYGRVSRSGIVAFASSLDQVGPFARTASDLALLLGAVAGFDPDDSTSASAPVPDYGAELGRGVAGLRIGLPDEYFIPGIDPDVLAAVESAVKVLEAAGAIVSKIRLPHTEHALSAYYLIAPAEASSNLARYDGVRYGLRVPDKDLRRMIVKTRSAGFGREVQRRILLGTFVLSAGYYEAYYGKAQKVRTLIRRDFEQAFAGVDLIATPTSPVTAFKLGERTGDPLSMYLADVFTLAVNLAGVPGVSVPAGFSGAGLPIGLQLIAPWFEESRLLRAAQVLEDRTDFAKRAPPQKSD